MIVSHKHKFIFIKTNKTAGTSIEIALSKHCGPDDIITPISPEDEATRRELGYPGPQNHLAPVLDHSVRDALKLLALRQGRRERFYNHMSAREVRDYVGDSVWNSYYKFCFERNPWDRVISHYYWRHKTEPRPTIAEYLESDSVLILKRRGYFVYTIDGRLAVDRVCRFEDIAGELEQVRAGLGIPEKLELPHAKSGYRKDKRSYRDILDENERNRVAEIFRDEIELMGYEF